jgi:hypothetical protein
MLLAGAKYGEDNYREQGKKILHVGIRLMIDCCRLDEANKQARTPSASQCAGTGGGVAGVTITVSTFSRRKRWILAYTANSAIDPKMMSISTTALLGTRNGDDGSPAGCVEFTF